MLTLWSFRNKLFFDWFKYGSLVVNESETLGNVQYEMFKGGNILTKIKIKGEIVNLNRRSLSLAAVQHSEPLWWIFDLRWYRIVSHPVNNLNTPSNCLSFSILRQLWFLACYIVFYHSQ